MNVLGVPRQNIVYLIDNSSSEIPSYVTADYNGSATYANVHHYIGTWLASKSYKNTFIYVCSHGGGFNGSALDGGKKDDQDGNEFLLSNGTWIGVDESIYLEADNSYYWDDQFKLDLSSFNSILTIVLQTCKSVNDTTSGLSCYSGGFIEDLSRNYATIITASNETGISNVGASVAEFTNRLMSAFSNHTIVYGGAYTHFDNSSPINWSCKSWRGAFEYALQNDPYYLTDQEFPWFDDDGNGLPGWINNTQALDFPSNAQDLMRWLEHDINYDGIVDIRDIVNVSRAVNTIPDIPRWNRQADVYPWEDWKVNLQDLVAVARDFGKRT